MPRARALGLAALLAGCASPQYKPGDLHCAATTPRCPADFYCAADQRCWTLGAGPDGGGAGTPSNCGTSKALLCDGFEDETIDAQWRVLGSAVALDKTRAYRGLQSIHLHTDAAAANSNPNAGLLEQRTFPISGTAWVRAWVYLQSPLSPNFDQVLNFLDAGTGGASFSIFKGSPVDNNYGGMGFKQSMLPIGTDRWTCLRMSIGQGGSSGDIHLFVDDAEATDAQLLGVPITQMVSVVVGEDFYGNPAMGATDMWIDEVEVDDQLINCSD
jgi:hypothetical protein